MNGRHMEAHLLSLSFKIITAVLRNFRSTKTYKNAKLIIWGNTTKMEPPVPSVHPIIVELTLEKKF